MESQSIQINEIVYVPGDYFDIEGQARWSKNVAKIDWKTQSLLGVVKSFEIKKHKNYVNVLWLVDYRTSCVLQADLNIFPKNLRPIIGVVDNFTILVAEYVIVQKKKNKIKKDISIYGMNDTDALSGLVSLTKNGDYDMGDGFTLSQNIVNQIKESYYPDVSDRQIANFESGGDGPIYRNEPYNEGIYSNISYNGRNYDQGKKIGIKDAFAALFCILKY